ncbi:hypothetical protein NIES2100_63240 [Calothrix sp. NIES-2100]|nr:hypothetical protein NIES2100_63240 [Calothrix sp. NIES-2100]
MELEQTVTTKPDGYYSFRFIPAGIYTLRVQPPSLKAQNFPSIHTDVPSDELNRSIQAKAFSTGQDLFFRQGAYESTRQTLQRQEENKEELQAKSEITVLQRQEESRNPNQTGLPDGLKAGVENLSGYSLDDVRVHYNSPKPAQLQALAYTQGTEIHVAPGQEEHLPHEAWHVVQQMQGRVKPTMQSLGMAINDDRALEREADLMGVKAAVDNRPETITQRKLLDTARKTKLDLSKTIVEDNSRIIQRWKSQTLEEESDKTGYERMIGLAMFYAEEELDSDIDEYSTDEELIAYLNDEEKEQFRYSRKLRELQDAGMADTIHHILSRKKIESLYKRLTPTQQLFFKEIFSRQTNIGGYRGISDATTTESLLSLRSNLVLEPEGSKRSDDPARIQGNSSDFDPVFESSGQMTKISLIYQKVDQIISTMLTQSKKELDQEAVNVIINLLLDAEIAYAEAQGQDSFWKTRMDLNIKDVWEGTNVGQKGESWKKKYRRGS